MKSRIGFLSIVAGAITVGSIAMATQKPLTTPRSSKIDVQTTRAVGSKKVIPKDAVAAVPFEATRDGIHAAVERRVNANRGTLIGVHADAKGENLRLQNAISRSFLDANFVPQDRLRHFSWLDNPNSPSMRITGWGGSITDVEPSQNGVFVTICVGPLLASGIGDVFTHDEYNEVYEYIGGRLNYIRGFDSPESYPRILIVN